MVDKLGYGPAMPVLTTILHRKYGTARNMLRVLGLDSAEINEALEQPHDVIDAESALSAIEEIVGSLPDDEMEEVLNSLEAALASEEPAQDRRRKRAADRRPAGKYRPVRLGRDEPPEFPGRPSPFGSQDPLEARAQDRVAARRHLLGQDSADSFERLFPNARRTRATADFIPGPRVL
jgi:hypothetical protein